MMLLRELTRCVRSWWSVDRIRISRSEGLLLQLQIGDRLLVMGKIWQVENKLVESSSEGILSDGLKTAEASERNTICYTLVEWEPCPLSNSLESRGDSDRTAATLTLLLDSTGQSRNAAALMINGVAYDIADGDICRIETTLQSESE
jgi:hypothetical protein